MEYAIENEGTLSTSNKLQKEHVEIDGISAAWLLFNFAKGRAASNNEKKATHIIKSVLPNGDLSVVNIEVESFYEKKDKKGGLISAGLPGAFAQDVYLSLLDSLIGQLKSSFPKEVGNLPVEQKKNKLIPATFTELYFRNKDIAENMGMTGKNARLTQAINHLHKTHIKIEGSIYRDGKVEKVSHETYYIQSVTTKKKIGTDKDTKNWNRVKFDETLVREVLTGYVAQMDKKTLLSLPSGPSRKLYSLIASKKLGVVGKKSLSITVEELLSVLQLKKNSFKQRSKVYFSALKEAGIINDYTFSSYRGLPVVVFMLPEVKKELTTDLVIHDVDLLFDQFEELSLKDINFRKVYTSSEFDIDKKILLKLYDKYYSKALKDKDYEFSVDIDGDPISKVCLWTQMLIWNLEKGQKITCFGLLKHCLSKDQEPEVRAGFKTAEKRLQQILADMEAKKLAIAKKQEEVRLNDALETNAEKYLENLTDKQKEKYLDLVAKYMMEKSKGIFGKDPHSLAVRSSLIGIIKDSISNGASLEDMSSLIKKSYEPNDSNQLELL